MKTLQVEKGCSVGKTERLSDLCVEPVWRDLKIGDEIRVGDRIYNPVDGWVKISEADVRMCNTVLKCHGPIQRQVKWDGK